MNRPNLFQQLLIFKISGRRAARNPCIIPTGGDAQHPTHGFDWKLGLICSHEFEDFGGTDPVSRANQAAAFARISRSYCRRRFSFTSRLNSCFSSLLAPSSRRTPSISACRIQLLIVFSVGYNSLSSSTTERPLPANS